MTEVAPEVEPAPQPIAWRRGQAVVLALGGLGMFVFGFPLLMQRSVLPQVDPRQADLGVRHGSGHLGEWLLYLLLAAVIILLVTGLPLARGRSARGATSGAVAQGVSGAAVVLWTIGVAQLASNFFFTGTSDECTYPNCWPLPAEEKAFVVPGIVTGVVMIVMALLRERVPWSVRALVPVAVWIVGGLIHYWIWTTYLVPVFERPPG